MPFEDKSMRIDADLRIEAESVQLSTTQIAEKNPLYIFYTKTFLAALF